MPLKKATSLLTLSASPFPVPPDIAKCLEDIQPPAMAAEPVLLTPRVREVRGMKSRAFVMDGNQYFPVAVLYVHRNRCGWVAAVPMVYGIGQQFIQCQAEGVEGGFCGMRAIFACGFFLLQGVVPLQGVLEQPRSCCGGGGDFLRVSDFLCK